MTARTFDPRQTPGDIAMTRAARGHVRRQLAKEGATALLLSIRESGCNGYMYDLSYVEGVEGQLADVRKFEFDGVALLVENANWPMLRGTEIDYVTEGLNSTLIFRNPNAVSECGCGESFAVQEAGA